MIDYEKLKLDKYYCFGFISNAILTLKPFMNVHDYNMFIDIIKYYGQHKVLTLMLEKTMLRKTRQIFPIIRKHLPEKWEVVPIEYVIKMPFTRTVEILNNELKIKFPFSWDTVNELKLKLINKKFNADKENPFWLAEISIKNITVLRQLGFHIDSTVEKHLQDNQAILPDNLQKILRQYQKEGVQFLIACEGKAILADDMGIGKTIQAIAYLAANPNLRPAIVAVPASLRLNWGREFVKWLPNEEYAILKDINKIDKNLNIGIMSFNFIGKTDYWTDKGSGKPILKTKKGLLMIQDKKRKNPIEIINMKPDETCDTPYEYVINYKKETILLRSAKTKNILIEEQKAKKVIDSFPIVEKLIKETNFKIVIVDEGHRINSPDNLQTKAIQKAVRYCKKFIDLTGTPIENKTAELFTALNLIDPKQWNNRYKFLYRYCDPKNNGFGWQFNGATNTEELFQKIQPYILRRTKLEVLPELPKKQRIIVPIETNNKSYDNLLNNLFSKTKSNNKTEAKNAYEALKQEAVKIKLPGCIDWIKDYLEIKNKLVVACTHREVVEKLHTAFPKNSVMLYGGMIDTKKQLAVDQFQENENINLIIGNIKTIGLGNTLTAASDTATVEFGWTSTLHDQLEDRVLRIGQTANTSNHYYLLAADTVEEAIIILLDRKRQLIAELIDGKKVQDIDLLTELMKIYKK